jgi:transcriptional regulator with XRE-family HTH domain
MQALFLTTPYTQAMQTGRPSQRPRPPSFGDRLHALRESAGLSQQQLAEKVRTSQRTISYWERSPVALRPDQLLTLAQALNISVEELVGDTHGRTRQRGTGPAGKLKQVFDAASKLPRRQQQKIAEFVEAFVLQQTNSQHL